MKEILHYPPPWNLKGEGFIIPFLPKKNVMLDSGFLSKEEQKNFKGGLGACMLVNYETSNVGPYFELLFIPGNFIHKSQNGKSKIHKRITKIYVSSEDSIREGRLNWAIPKEFANFTWTKENNTTKIVVTTKDGITILDTSITKRFFAFPITTKLYPVSLIQTSDTNQIIQTEFSGYGKANFAKLNNWTCDKKYFVDLLENSKFHFTLSVSNFNITFPISEILS